MRRQLAGFMCGLIWASFEPSIASAQNSLPVGDTISAAAHRARGLQSGYNLDHAEALAAFNDAIAADPTHPAAYRLAAATVWTRLLFEQGAITADDYLGQAKARLRRQPPKPEHAAEFHTYIRQALALSELRLRQNPTDADAHYQIGAALSCLASYIATVDGRVLDSLGPARRAYKAHERALVLDAGRKDAALIVGLMRHAVAELSMPLRLIARLAGFNGSRDRALQLVEEAAQYPGETQRNASFSLVLLYNRDERYDAALQVIRDLQQRYPRNRLLWLESGNTLLRAGRPADAKAMLEEGLAQFSHDARPRAPGEDSRWRLALGSALVSLKLVSSAERELNTAHSGAVQAWVRGRIHRELAKLADLSGDRPRALREYEQARELCHESEDSECVTEVKRLVRHRYR